MWTVPTNQLQDSTQHGLWIHSSTGQLTADIQPPLNPDDETHLFPGQISNMSYVKGFTTQEATAIESLSLRQYHEICDLHFAQDHVDFIPTTATVTPGVMSSWPKIAWGDSLGIASLPSADFYIREDWSLSFSDLTLGADLMGNGWMRCRSHDFSGNLPNEIVLNVHGPDRTTWLSQANHIFSSLSISSNLDDYVLVYKVEFEIRLVHAAMSPCPAGYLFLCPPADFEISGGKSFRWPRSFAYWSLEPSGVPKLSTEEAKRLGFPAFQLNTWITGWAWDDSVYAGIRKLHEAKGFDPNGRAVAQHLNEPLYELAPMPLFSEGENLVRITRRTRVGAPPRRVIVTPKKRRNKKTLKQRVKCTKQRKRTQTLLS
ncbi:hypothetical protein C8R46DRAFT_367605 [Mycena filopes]|nr:hypothetical protein C8R46DRAFT_367605 [Mycena filopes]